MFDDIELALRAEIAKLGKMFDAAEKDFEAARSKYLDINKRAMKAKRELVTYLEERNSHAQH